MASGRGGDWDDLIYCRFMTNPAAGTSAPFITLINCPCCRFTFVTALQREIWLHSRHLWLLSRRAAACEFVMKTSQLLFLATMFCSGVLLYYKWTPLLVPPAQTFAEVFPFRIVLSAVMNLGL